MALWISSNICRKIGTASISVRAMTRVFRTSSSLRAYPRKLRPVNFQIRNQVMRKSFPSPSLSTYCTQAGPNETGEGTNKTGEGRKPNFESKNERKSLSVVGRLKLWINEQKHLLSQEKGSQASFLP
jgi:hypothetical protein